MEFKDKFLELREFYKLSKTETAERLGVPISRITSWESGKSKPNFEQILDICKMFDLSVDEFLEDLDEKNLQDNIKPVPKAKHQLIFWFILTILFIFFVIVLYQQFA